MNESLHITRGAKVVAILVVAFLVALCLRVFVVEGFLVQGDSMYPVIQNGEYLFVDKLAYIHSTPKVGDIIVAYPRRYNEKVVKRVAGLPGDVMPNINGNAYKVDPGEYYLLGDNQAVSIDSRVFGPVDPWDIKGRVIGAFDFKHFKYVGL